MVHKPKCSPCDKHHNQMQKVWTGLLRYYNEQGIRAAKEGKAHEEILKWKILAGKMRAKLQLPPAPCRKTNTTQQKQAKHV